jgi:hypothetical protein
VFCILDPKKKIYLDDMSILSIILNCGRNDVDASPAEPSGQVKMQELLQLNHRRQADVADPVLVLPTPTLFRFVIFMELCGKL